jgi:type I restriction enzyme S subunit
MNQLKNVLVTGAQPNVSPSEVESFEFAFPQDIDEQKKIGDYFRNLDRLITLHQRKSKCLKNAIKSIKNIMITVKELLKCRN